MTAPERGGARAAGLERAAVDALREIIADPSLPVRGTADGPGGARLAALREAHDYLNSHRLAAGATASADAAADLISALGDVDPELAATLHWHATLAPVVAALPASRARNALLGDIARGDLLTLAAAGPSWAWAGGVPPGDTGAIGRATGDFTVDTHPGLYNAVLVWAPADGVLVIVPTHRARVRWAPADPAVAGRWTVELDRVTFHRDELIRLDHDPFSGLVGPRPSAAADAGRSQPGERGEALAAATPWTQAAT